jgi:hypothetical protein
MLTFIAWLLPLLACGPVNPLYQFDTGVRQAIYEYDQVQRGQVDDLVIHFRLDEPRTRFVEQNQHGGRTVWLPGSNAAEFFTARPPERTYLYIQEIQYNETHTKATVAVYRGDSQSYQGWEVTLTRDNNQRWTVTHEVELEGTPSP